MWHAPCLIQQQDIGSHGGTTGIHLFPLTWSEFRAHALELERHAETRYGEYAMRMHYLDARRVADAFERLKMLQKQEVKALEAEAEVRSRSWHAPWEYVRRLTHPPDALGSAPPVPPNSAREALQLVIAMEKRAGAYYAGAATQARDAAVRACAGEMAGQKNRRLELLEQLLALETGAGWARVASLAGNRPPVA